MQIRIDFGVEYPELFGLFDPRELLSRIDKVSPFDRGGLLLPTVVLSLDLENSTPVVNCGFFCLFC